MLKLPCLIMITRDKGKVQDEEDESCENEGTDGSNSK